MLTLQVLQGPDRGKSFRLPANEPQLIGRSSEALPITDTTVSRRHAELTPDEGQWFLRDLESANGTYVNGQKIRTRLALSPGDQIRCGSTLLVLAAEADEPPESPVQIMTPEVFDVTVEQTISGADDSVILAAPDPVRAAMDHLRIVYDLTELTGSAFERDELLDRVMDLIFREFEPDRGFILLQDRPDGAPEPAVVRYKQRPRSLDEGRIPVSRTIISHTIERREGILSTNAMNDSRFASGDSVRDYGIRSAICVPILHGERVFGVIHIDSSMANFTFSDSQLQLMKAIGQHTGLALTGAAQIRHRLQTERLAAVGGAVASLSHSIKNILQGLRGGADAVELSLNRDDLGLAREGWPILARNLDRIYALTLNMLTWSRPRQLDLELTPLGALIEEVCELLRPQTERKSIAVMHEIADDMPPVPVDPNAIHQALMNLMTNAIDALPRRGVITVSARYDAEPGRVQIAITDNGPGIPPDRQEDIFEAFSSSKGQRGTGLGLAVTRKIVQEHEGTISLVSTEGKGATFTITLPASLVEQDPADTRLPRATPGADDPF